MNIRRIGVLLPALLIVGLVVAACGGGGATPTPVVVTKEVVVTPTPAGPPIKIGIPYGLSSIASVYTRGAVKGHNLAVAEINAAGGVLGRPFELVVRETNLRPDIAVQVVQQMVDGGVEFIVGTISSGVAQAISGFAKDNKIIFIDTIAQASGTTAEAGHRYVFRTTTNTVIVGRALAGVMAQRPETRYVTIGPDYSFGWGLVDTEAAANHIKQNSESPDSSPMLESTLADSTLHSLFFTWDGVGPIRATICWTDPAAANGSGLDDTTLKLINDLDLRIYGPGGSPTYSPYVLDPANPAALATTGDNFRDNVEQVYIASPGTPGAYELVVTHKSTLSGGSQIYSLILDGAASDLNVTPATGLSTSGTRGAIGKVNQAYTLTNTTGVSIDWTASIGESWATLSKTSGTLGAGANDSVMVTIESMRANQFATGSYSDTLMITNTGTNETVGRPIALTVDTPFDTVYSFPPDSDPGWTTEGQWAFGVPQGLGNFGGDPFSGHTGSNVYGYNLFGDYANDLAEQNLTTTAMDFSGASVVKLTFWRWLGIESSIYDEASVRVSADGSSWTTIWSHSSGSFNDAGWVQQSFDISAVADGEAAVYVRWVMGATDVSITYPGWNIDDVTFEASVNAPSAVWVDFADVGSTQDGTQSEPFIELFPAVITLVADGSGVVNIKGDTAVSDTNMTGVLLKPMTIQAIEGPVRIGVP